jgi:hypothetical protein
MNHSTPARGFGYVGSRRQSDAAFPLTPALSLGEREDVRQRVREADTLGTVERLSSVLPLPKGEGWGEGEQAALPSTPFEVAKCPASSNPFKATEALQ